ncbi:MAG: hypothetical protein WCF10_20680 [Polyangiales bacterium]
MDSLYQLDPELRAEVRRRQAEVWTDLMTILKEAWASSRRPRMRWEARISADEILADLAYGRD